jgi:hypothetical protein
MAEHAGDCSPWRTTTARARSCCVPRRFATTGQNLFPPWCMWTAAPGYKRFERPSSHACMGCYNGSRTLRASRWYSTPPSTARVSPSWNSGGRHLVDYRAPPRPSGHRRPARRPSDRPRSLLDLGSSDGRDRLYPRDGLVRRQHEPGARPEFHVYVLGLHAMGHAPAPRLSRRSGLLAFVDGKSTGHAILDRLAASGRHMVDEFGMCKALVALRRLGVIDMRRAV